MYGNAPGALAAGRDAGQPHIFPALYGLSAFHLVSGACHTARRFAQQALRFAQKGQASDFLVPAHTMLGIVSFACGAFTTAQEHLEQGLSRYGPEQHHALAFRYGDDPGVHCLAYLTIILWMLGYPDRAQTRSTAAVTLARRLKHPFSLAIPLVSAAVSSQFRNEGTTVLAWAEAIIALATEQEFAHWLGAGMMLPGWALAQQGQVQQGMEHLHQGLTGWRVTGASQVLPYWLALLAEAYG